MFFLEAQKSVEASDVSDEIRSGACALAAALRKRLPIMRAAPT